MKIQEIRIGQEVYVTLNNGYVSSVTVKAIFGDGVIFERIPDVWQNYAGEENIFPTYTDAAVYLKELDEIVSNYDPKVASEILNRGFEEINSKFKYDEKAEISEGFISGKLYIAPNPSTLKKHAIEFLKFYKYYIQANGVGFSSPDSIYKKFLAAT